MRLSFSSLLCLVTAFCIFSCSKKKEAAAASKPQVTKIKTWSSGATDGTWHYYNRNAQGQLTSEFDTGYNYSSTIQYDYDANGKVSKITNSDIHNGILYYYEFEYNAAGKIVKRNLRDLDGVIYQYNTYQYDGLNHVLADSFYSRRYAANYELVGVTKFSYNSGNVTEITQYIFEYVVGLPPPAYGQLKFHRQWKYEYDAHENASRVSDNEYQYKAGESDVYLGSTYLSSNNITKIFFRTYPDAYYGTNAAYTYEYDANGYVKKVKDTLIFVEREFFYE